MFRLAVVITSLAILGQAEPPRQSFRTSTRVVTIDALVHGKDGEPIRNLTANDFRLFEDGKEQRIEFFSVVQSSARRSAPAAAMVQAPIPGTFTNRPAGSIPTATTIILFDRLNSRFEDQVPARAEVVKFLNGVHANDRVALYVLESNAVRVLHDFTHDSASLVETMKRYRAQTSFAQAVADDPAPQDAPSGVTSVDLAMQKWLNETTETIAAEFTRQRAQFTLSAIEAIADHVSAIPGRKNLVWVSSAFPLVISDRFGPQTLSRELTRAVQAVNSSNLSIYPIDLRGLVAPFSGPAATATYQGRGGAPPPQSAMATIQPNIDTMAELAARTGGRAFYNTNAIGRAIERAIDDSRVTYLLGYLPTNDAWDGRFRKLRVTVRTPDAEVRHRSGYMAIPQTSSRNNERMTDLARAPLESTGIGLTVSLVGSELTIRVEPGAITLKPTGELWEAAVDILIAESTKSGEMIKHLDRTLNLRLNREQRDELMREGFSMTRTVERRSGDAPLRVVVRDTATGVAGSVTISR